MSELEEKAEAILHITLPCGCPATWDSIFDGYVVDGEHTCDGTVLAAQKQEFRAARLQSRQESYQRSSATLYRKPFSILR